MLANPSGSIMFAKSPPPVRVPVRQRHPAMPPVIQWRKYAPGCSTPRHVPLFRFLTRSRIWRDASQKLGFLPLRQGIALRQTEQEFTASAFDEQIVQCLGD